MTTIDITIYKRLADFGRELLEKRTLSDRLPSIAEFAKKIIGTKRASVFIYNTPCNDLRTTLADGVEKIVIAANKGVVGETPRKASHRK